MERLRQYDYGILIAVLALVGVGMVMIYSSSCILAQERFGDSFHFLKRQALFAVLGIVLMIAAMNFPYENYRRVAYPLLLVGVLALVAVLIPPFGHRVGGANRWLHLGPITVQPSEGVKLIVVIYLAYSLSRKRERGIVRRLVTGFLPHLLVAGLVGGLLFKEPDLGSALIVGGLAFIMMFLAGVRLTYLLLTAGAAAPLLYRHLQGYQWDRIGVFLQYLFAPWEAPLKEAYHIKQACYALANGGLLGMGLGMGRQKLFYLPEPHTDFIIAVVGEEWGFLGILVVCFLFLVILVGGAKIAMAVKDQFGSLLAMGIVAMIGLQGSINMAMAMGLLPTKGMALPFLSYGGSSLVTNLLAIGLLIQLSGQAQQREGP